MRISRVDAPTCEGGENPLWDDAAGVLWYVDNSGRKIHRHDPASGANRTWELPSVVTTLALRASGGLVLTLRNGIHFLDPDSERLEALHPLPDPPPYVYNDGVVDARGRFLIGASTARFDDPQPDGGLYRLDGDHSLHRIDGDIHFSNSNCFSPDQRRFYFSDSWRKTIYRYDYDLETGGATGRSVFVQTDELGGLPDGATCDADGLLWVAIYGGGVIAAYRPDGTLERTVAMPVKLVSSVAFGGPGLDRLYVTTIAHGSLGEPVEPGAGDLYVIDGLGARGLPEHRYAG